MKETDIQRQCLDYLSARHLFHFRCNSGMAKVGKRYIRYGVSGCPDIICVIKGQFVGVEVKDADGKQSHDQWIFQQDLERAGGRYLLVRSVEELEAALK